MSAVERALIAYLGVTISPLVAVQIKGLRAWSALPIGAAPSEVPWAHEPDLGALADDLRRP